MDDQTVFLPDVVADDRTAFAGDSGWAHDSGLKEDDFSRQQGLSVEQWLSRPFVPEGVSEPVSGPNILADAAQHLFNHAQVLLEGGRLSQARALFQEDMELFERAAHEAGMEWPRIRLARYVLCTFCDELLSRSGTVVEGQSTLLFHFHQETWGGEGVFWALKQCCEKPSLHWMEIELIYMCLNLGFQGQFRREKDGRQQLERIRTMVWGVLKRLGRSAPSNGLMDMPVPETSPENRRLSMALRAAGLLLC
ncbi:MAG: DotU family type IV/VI secretion system protein, partial [Gammaproteobacteria bacterium]